MGFYKTFKKSSVALISVTALLGLSACGGSSNSNDDTSGDDQEISIDAGEDTSNAESGQYPDEIRTTFLDSCVQSAGGSELSDADFAMVEDLCGCVLESLEAELSYDEFVEAEQDILAGTASGIDLEAIATLCMQ